MVIMSGAPTAHRMPPPPPRNMPPPHVRPPPHRYHNYGRPILPPRLPPFRMPRLPPPPPPHLFNPRGMRPPRMMMNFRMPPPPPYRMPPMRPPPPMPPGRILRRQKGVPVARLRFAGNSPKPWISEEIKAEITKQQQLAKTARETKTSEAWDLFKSQKQKCHQMIRDARIAYFKSRPNQPQESFQINPKTEMNQIDDFTEDTIL